MKMKYTARVTYFKKDDNLFNHMEIEELIAPQSTKDYIKELFIKKIDGRVSPELEEYDSFLVEIISEERYDELS